MVKQFSEQIYNESLTHLNLKESFLGVTLSQKVVKIVLIIFYLFFLLSLTYGVSESNDVKAHEVKEGAALLINKWAWYSHDEMPIYQYMTEENQSIGGSSIDTSFYYLKTIKIDSSSLGNRIGIAGNLIIENEDGVFIEFIKSEEIKAEEPNYEDFLIGENKDKLSKKEFVSLDHIMLETTKELNGWVMFFITGLVVFFLLDKTIKALKRMLSKKIPIYVKKPIYTRDRRYKSGKRIDGYFIKIEKYEKLNGAELAQHKKQQQIRFAVFLPLLILALFYLFSLL